MTEVIRNVTGIEIEGPYGFVPFEGLFISEPEDGLTITTESGKSIQVSTDHQFMKVDKVVVANTLAVGDDAGFGKIKSIEKTRNMVHYGPLSVCCGEYLTSSGIRSHNCQFIGSSTTLVSADVLDKMKANDPIRYEKGYSLRIFEDPIPNAFYVMGVDVAAGTGKDYSVIQVLKINARKDYVQVATYADCNVRTGTFSQIIQEISQKYNNAMAIIESNEIGSEVLNELVYTLDAGDIVINTDSGSRLGTRATKASKIQACNNLKTIIDEGQLQINDIDTIRELAIFEEVAPNIFKAPRNKHDDLVSGLYWACYALLQPQIDLDDLQVSKHNTEEEFYSPVWFD